MVETTRTTLIWGVFSSRSLMVNNLSLIESSDSQSSLQSLPDRDALVRVIWERFGIPAAITGEVVRGMDPLGDAWS